jgi:tetratricopeptide (TPR) repeat protein
MTPQVIGRKVTAGLEITSQEAAAPFSMTLGGTEIKPLDPNRLQWDIDGLKLELTYALRNLTPAAEADYDLIEQFRRARSAARQPPSSPGNNVERFACDSDRTCLVWGEDYTSATRSWIAAATNGKLLLLLESRSGPIGESERIRNYLIRSLGSVAFGSIAPPAQAKKEEVGFDLAEQLALHNRLHGVPHTALLNSRYTTPKDAQLAITLDPVTLLEFLKLLLAANGISRFRNGVMPVTVNVFDGTVGHVISADGFDSQTHRLYYEDPLGTRSFLQGGNNRANTNALRDATNPRIWSIDETELERVLHSVVFPATNVWGMLRLSTLLAGDPEKAILSYMDLRTQDIASGRSTIGKLGMVEKETRDDRLQRIQKYLVDAGRVDQAVTIFRIRAALDQRDTEAVELERTLGAANRTDLVRALNSPHPERILPSLPVFDLENATSSEFFRWFHLTVTGTVTDKNGATVTTFKPSGPAFHDLVDLHVTLKGNSAQRWTLLIDRAFLNSTDRAPLAADLARSFLEFTLPGTTSGSIKDLKDEIGTWWKSERKFVPVLGAGPLTKAPAMPSQAYMAYLGNPGEFVQPLRNGRLAIDNIREGNKSRLQILVERASLPYVAALLKDLGKAYYDAHRLVDAESAYRDASNMYRDVDGATSSEHAKDIAAILDSLADLYYETGRLQEAEKAQTGALQNYRQLASKDPAYRGDLADALANLAGLYYDMHRLNEAQALVTEALGIYRDLAATAPVEYGADLVETLSLLGEVYQAEGQRAGAAATCNEALAIYKGLAEKQPAHTAELRTRVKELYCFQ